MWVSVNGKLRVLGARDESSILSTRTINLTFSKNFSIIYIEKEKIVASFKGRKRV